VTLVRRSHVPRGIARQTAPAGRLTCALVLSLAGHLGALSTFGYLRPLPAAVPTGVMLVELSSEPEGKLPEVLDIAPGDPLGTRPEMRLAPSRPAHAEGPEPSGELVPAPPPDAATALDDRSLAEPTPAAVAGAEPVAGASLELPQAEAPDLAAQLATEQERASRVEWRLRDLEREREVELAAVRATYERLVEALRGELADKEVALREASGRLSVSIVDRVLFPSGHADLTPAGRRIMDRISTVLVQADDHRILVEGHSDDVPIGPALRQRFPSNWELSTMRATEVVKYLVARGVPSANLTAAGRADTAPVASNRSETGRRQNRRIEIILLPPADRLSAPGAVEAH
jgi:flagellar motor protein MotB